MTKKIERMSQSMLSFCRNLATEKLTSDGKDFASYKIDNNKMLITKQCVNFNKINVDDIQIVEIDENNSNNEIAIHSALYKKYQNTNAISHLKPFKTV